MGRVTLQLPDFVGAAGGGDIWLDVEPEKDCPGAKGRVRIQVRVKEDVPDMPKSSQVQSFMARRPRAVALPPPPRKKLPRCRLKLEGVAVPDFYPMMAPPILPLNYHSTFR